MKYLFLPIILFLCSCKPQEKKLTAQEIIDKSISYSGVDRAENANISFNFRDKKYTAFRKNGIFKLDRIYSKNNSTIREVISNKSAFLYRNDTLQQVSDSVARLFSNSVNSVHYFSVLPFGLNDKAVLKKRLPNVMIKGKEYYKIEISFSQNGGGEDFEDIFIYWIGKEDFLVDYLAYSYHTDGGGKRFRVLKEQCLKEGIRFVDYYNYKPLSDTISLLHIDKAFENKQLKKVSEIVLKNIDVLLLENKNNE